MKLIKAKDKQTARNVAGIFTAGVVLAFWLLISALFEGGVWAEQYGFNIWSVLK